MTSRQIFIPVFRLEGSVHQLAYDHYLLFGSLHWRFLCIYLIYHNILEENCTMHSCFMQCRKAKAKS